MNKLYFGDNLEIMREMEAESVDLICTDPPFNSGRNYNAFFTESKVQSKAYTDIWQWDDAAKSKIYKHPSYEFTAPRLQIYQIQDYYNDVLPKLPYAEKSLL